MGKGNRNREAKRNQPPPEPHREMLANSPDSLADNPGPGGLSANFRDHVDPKVQAWGLMQAYSSFLMELTAPERPEPGPEASDQEREVHRLLTTLQPHMLQAAPDDAAEFVALMKPRWRGEATRTIFAETATWLAESGREPDERDLFAGASSFARFMLPAHHQDEGGRLLDYDRLRERAAQVNQPFPDDEQIPLFSWTNPDNTIFFDAAMQAHPVVMVHAAAALATWVQHLDGAVLNLNEKRVALGERAIEYGKLLAAAPERSEHEAEEDEPPWVPPWVIADEVPTRENTAMGQPVPVHYDGPALTPWHAAWLWAQAMLHSDSRNSTYGDRECVMVARGITAVAKSDGIDIDVPAVDSPEAFSSASMYGVYLNALDDAQSAVMFVQPQGASPTADEPGYDAYRELMATFSITGDDVAQNPDLAAEVQQGVEEWQAVVKNARTMVLGAILANAVDPNADAPLSLFGNSLNDYLRQQRS